MLLARIVPIIIDNYKKILPVQLKRNKQKALKGMRVKLRAESDQKPRRGGMFVENWPKFR